MQDSVDLTNLREMTDGDTELEKLLFEEFYSSFETGIEALQANCNADTAEVWRAQSHALKGVALNLGAGVLGELCKKGQDEPLADSVDKEKLIQQIRSEYDKVKAYLRAIG